MAKFKELEAKGLKDKLKKEDSDVLLVDTLGEGSYKRAHIPSAEMVSAHGTKEEFVKEVEELVSDRSQEIVVYCASHSCGLSPKAAEWLASEGFENVYDFSGGLQEWVRSGYSLEGEEAQDVTEKLQKK